MANRALFFFTSLVMGASGASSGCSPRMHRAYRASTTMATISLNVMAARQTDWALKHVGSIEEKNPIYGTNPSTARLAATVAIGDGLLIVLHHLNEKLPDDNLASHLIKDVLMTVPLAFSIFDVWSNTGVL